MIASTGFNKSTFFVRQTYYNQVNIARNGFIVVRIVILLEGLAVWFTDNNKFQVKGKMHIHRQRSSFTGEFQSFGEQGKYCFEIITFSIFLYHKSATT